MTLTGVVAQAQPAHAKAPVKSPRPAAQRTAIILPHLELVRPLGLDPKTCLGQWILSSNSRTASPLI